MTEKINLPLVPLLCTTGSSSQILLAKLTVCSEACTASVILSEFIVDNTGLCAAKAAKTARPLPPDGGVSTELGGD